MTVENNVAKLEARERKAIKIAALLSKQTLTDAQVVDLRFIDQATRELVAQQAGVRTPSDATWARAIVLLINHRAGVTELQDKITGMFARQAGR